ncbi:FCD domain-containing protein [Micromonospora sp. ATA51]|nr:MULTISPECIES: FCD domain-containing protein [unclassified Micromonospora]MBM0226733.1 FCD domain-containing protein [Micromonospora sp. ATA51]
MASLNTAFHVTVAQAAGNAYLELVAAPVLQRAQWVFLRTAAKRAPHSWREHAAVLEAITSGDEDAAEAAARSHVAAAQESFLAAIAKLRTGTEH